MYFNGNDDPVTAGAKLQALLAASNHNAEVLESTYRTLLSGGSVLRELVKWFEETSLSHWKDVPVATRLQLASGELPEQILKLENYSDLLQFPAAAVRQAAAEKLRRDFFPEDAHSAILLSASPRNRMSRYQTIFLLSALGAERDTRYSLIAAWFNTKPDPQTVLDLVILRRNMKAVDPLSIDGIRYLREQDMALTRPELLKLLSHNEPLVRAWAYTKLDISNPEDLRLLREALKKETLPALKKQIRLKLEDVWDETGKK